MCFLKFLQMEMFNNDWMDLDIGDRRWSDISFFALFNECCRFEQPWYEIAACSIYACHHTSPERIQLNGPEPCGFKYPHSIWMYAQASEKHRAIIICFSLFHSLLNNENTRIDTHFWVGSFSFALFTSCAARLTHTHTYLRLSTIVRNFSLSSRETQKNYTYFVRACVCVCARSAENNIFLLCSLLFSIYNTIAHLDFTIFVLCYLRVSLLRTRVLTVNSIHSFIHLSVAVAVVFFSIQFFLCIVHFAPCIFHNLLDLIFSFLSASLVEVTRLFGNKCNECVRCCCVFVWEICR